MTAGDHAAGTLGGEGAPDGSLACPECGRHDLHEDSPHEFAGGLIDRLICQACGAHRLS